MPSHELTDSQRRNIILAAEDDDYCRRRDAQAPAKTAETKKQDLPSVKTIDQIKRKAPQPTLIFVKHSEIGGRHFPFGSECPPGLLTARQVEEALDGGWLKEYPVRSLYAAFHLFR